MTVLNQANKIYIGGAQASAVYLGTYKVWPVFKPTDLGSNLLGWFDGADANTVQIVGSGVNNWVNKGVSAMTLTQSTDAYRPTYANQTVTFTSQILNATNPPASYDVIWVGKPKPVSVGTYRTLIRNVTAPHLVIIEAGSTRFGTYNTGFFPATVLVSPTNMTSDSSPPFIISQSDGLGASYEAFRAFDGNASTYTHSAVPVSTHPYWIKIDLGVSQFVSYYRYQPRPDGGGTVPYQEFKSWILEGSNNDSTWTLVDTVTNEADFAYSEMRTYLCDVPASFRYWRWTVTVGGGYDPPYAAAAALELYGGLTWDNVWGIGCGRFGDSQVATLSRDGGPMMSTGTTITAGQAVPSYIGAYQGPPPSQDWGDIKEMIFLPYNSESLRLKVEGYLAYKYGLYGLLPVDHPYKTTPP
jgi:hypothetical protein